MIQSHIKLLATYGYDSTIAHWPYLYWGGGIDAAIKHASLVMEDHSYTFKTEEQHFSVLLPYGPKPFQRTSS